MDPKSKLPETNLSLRVDRETLEKFRRIAEAQHRTMAGELRRLLEAHIADYEQEREAA